MSWSGTVQCRYCKGEGHNRRTCPDYKALLKQRADEGSKWAASTLERRSRKSTRKCGWCKGTGHNKRTCPVKDSAYEMLPQLEAALVNLIQKATGGVGRGSIFNLEYVTSNVALTLRKTASFGNGHISEEIVKNNEGNESWLTRILRSLCTGIEYECIAPDGNKRRERAPQRTLNFRGNSIRVGSMWTKVAVANPTPIACEVDIILTEGITDIQIKGWLKVIDLLIKETGFGEARVIKKG